MRESDPQSSWWWIESRSTATGSTWLQSILTELNEKTKAMLGLIEQDADTFAQRAEMYYKKRPELISMVEDFYRAYRSLAEQLDHVKSKSRTCLVTRLTTFGTPFTLAKHVPTKIMSSLDISNDSYYATYYPDEYEACYAEENAESEVDDPEDQDEVRIDLKANEEELQVTVDTNGVLKPGAELEKLREEFPIKEENVDSKIDDLEDEDEVQFDYRTKEEELYVAVDTTNDDEMLKSTPEFERASEVFSITAENAESEIDYPDDRDQVQLHYKIKEEEFPIMVHANDEVLERRAEQERSRAKCSITGKNAESEIDYSENQNEVQVDYKSIEEEYPSTVDTNDEVLNLRTELERVREENKIHEDNLNQKDEEKKEAIRHLSLAVNVLKEDNERIRKFIATQSPKKQNLTQLEKLKGAFRKLFSGTPRPGDNLLSPLRGC